MQMSLDDNRRQNYERLFAFIDFISDPTMTVEYGVLHDAKTQYWCRWMWKFFLLVFSSRIICLFVLVHELYDASYKRDVWGDENWVHRLLWNCGPFRRFTIVSAVYM